MSRRISKSIENVVNNRLQTEGNRSKLTSIVEIKRPYTVLKDDNFLEQLVINTGIYDVTDIDIAVDHPRLSHPNDTVYIAAISNGMARVYSSKTSYIMDKHNFIDMGYELNAIKVAIGFNTTYERNGRKRLEAITADYPMLFYVTPERQLWCLNLETSEKLLLVSENVYDITCVSATWTNSYDFDYGFIVFYISLGELYAIRLIRNEWYRPERILFDSSTDLVSVTATITWDYRIAVTTYDSSGNSRILFTNFLGLGKDVHETVVLNSVNIDGTHIPVERPTQQMAEKVDLSLDTLTDVTIKGPARALYAENIPDHIPDYGRIVRVWFTTFIKNSPLYATNYVTLTDSLGHVTTPLNTVVNTDTKSMDFLFDGFNDFTGPLTIKYENGYIINEYDYVLSSFELTFDPYKLSGLPVPKMYENVELSVDTLNDLHKIKHILNEFDETVSLSLDVTCTSIKITDL